MSSILKALRKLEEEKTELGEGSLDIGRDILRLPRKRKESRRALLLASFAAVFLVSGVLAGLLFRSSRPLPAAPISHSDTVGGPQRPVDPSMDSSKRKTEVIAAPTSFSGIETQERIPEVRIDNPTVARFSENSLPAPRKIPVKTPDPPVAPKEDGPALRLSGIAYQQDPESRVAIIDDLPVMKGASVEGGTVTEILTDRVRIRRDDGSETEILLQ